MLQPTAPVGRPNRPIAALGFLAWLTALGLVAGLALAGQDRTSRPLIAPTAAAVGQAPSSTSVPTGAGLWVARPDLGEVRVLPPVR